MAVSIATPGMPLLSIWVLRHTTDSYTYAADAAMMSPDLEKSKCVLMIMLSIAIQIALFDSKRPLSYD